jgi:lipoate-protein ligase A
MLLREETTEKNEAEEHRIKARKSAASPFCDSGFSLPTLCGADSLEEIDVYLHPDGEPQAQMDFDRRRAEAVARGEARAMFRLYSWKPYAVSLGAHQKESDIDAARARARNIAIVRRPTGGRAVFHAAELTYSLVTPIATAREPKRTVHEIYRDVHILLLQALRLLSGGGASELDFQKTQSDFRLRYKSGVAAAPCFASSARYEIVFNNRKIIGSAQKKYGNVLLQHGSILLDNAHEELAELMNLPDDAARAAMKQMIREHSATLREACGREIGFEECAAAILSVLPSISIP